MHKWHAEGTLDEEPTDTFHALASLGKMGEEEWIRLPPSRRGELADAYRAHIEDLLSLATSKRREIITNGEAGAAVWLGLCEARLNAIEDVLRRDKDLSDFLSLDQVEHDVLHGRDELAYATVPLSELGISWSDSLRDRIEAIDQRLRWLLPFIIRSYVKSGELVKEEVGPYPASFWWRHVL